MGPGPGVQASKGNMVRDELKRSVGVGSCERVRSKEENVIGKEEEKKEGREMNKAASNGHSPPCHVFFFLLAPGRGRVSVRVAPHVFSRL